MYIFGFLKPVKNNLSILLDKWLNDNLGGSFRFEADNLPEDFLNFLLIHGGTQNYRDSISKILKIENKSNHFALYLYENGDVKDVALVPHHSALSGWYTIPCRSVFFVYKHDRSLFVRLMPISWNKIRCLKEEPEALLFT